MKQKELLRQQIVMKEYKEELNAQDTAKAKNTQFRWFPFLDMFG